MFALACQHLSEGLLDLCQWAQCRSVSLQRSVTDVLRLQVSRLSPLRNLRSPSPSRNPTVSRRYFRTPVHAIALGLVLTLSCAVWLGPRRLVPSLVNSALLLRAARDAGDVVLECVASQSAARRRAPCGSPLLAAEVAFL